MTLPITDDGRPGAEVPVLNTANVLTVLRIVLVPVFVVLFFVADAQDPWWRVGAFVVFVFAMATDYVDGYLARRLGLVTDFGKIADPIADKALMAAAMSSDWELLPPELVVLALELLPPPTNCLKTCDQVSALSTQRSKVQHTCPSFCLKWLAANLASGGR